MIRTDEERASRAEWARRRRRLGAYHRWAPFVDPSRARAHVTALREGGLSLASIAVMAGEHWSSLSTLMQPNNADYQALIRPAREAAILAVRFDLDLVPDGRWVPAEGTRRRIQALSSMGWSQRWIADQLGVTVQAVGSYRTPKRAKVCAGTARTIRDLYEGHCMTAGPCVRAAMWAKSRGWAPPLAWDNIDDPDAVPNHGAPNLQIKVDIENVEWLLDQAPFTVGDLAARFDVTKSAIEHTCARRGRRDLLARMVVNQGRAA